MDIKTLEYLLLSCNYTIDEWITYKLTIPLCYAYVRKSY